MKKTILLGLTTTPGSDWLGKCLEIDRFGIEEIALFPTFLKPFEREKLHRALAKTKLKSIPHVHLRDDHTDEEIMFYVEKYGTRLFNVHPNDYGIATLKQLKQLGLNGYVENSGMLGKDFEKIVASSGGLCVDYSHFEDHWYLSHEPDYETFTHLIDKYKIGCCHVSAVTKEKHPEFSGESRFGLHRFLELRDLDYIGNYLKYLPVYISLELENTFEEQLKAKEYIENKFLMTT